MATHFDADLYRLAFQFSSIEETRYYLRGVYVEAHPVEGVTLTAIDGPRMLVIHDKKGSTDRSIIVRLSPEALKACKAKRNRFEPVETRRITITDNHAIVTLQNSDETETRLALTDECIIDGSFPDWRRVVPSAPFDAAGPFPAFDGKHLASFAASGPDLANRRNPAMVVMWKDSASPALIRWNDVDNAFGVLMPMRHSIEKALPGFLAQAA